MVCEGIHMQSVTFSKRFQWIFLVFIVHSLYILLVHLFTTPSQPHSCSEAALSLMECLEKLPCVTEEKRPVLECLKDEYASDGCRDVRYAYSMCKYSQLNMRTRIRGVRTF